MGLASSKLSGAPFTVTYFDIPALAEPIRLLLELSGQEWVDNRIQFKDWSDLKPTTKWGQLPVVRTGDGTEMTQTKPIVRLLASHVIMPGDRAPLYPVARDPMGAYKVDEIIETFEDVRMKLVPTMKIEDKAEKEAARAALFEAGGGIADLLSKLELEVQEDGFMVPGSLSVTLADLWAFWFFCFLKTGFFDGVPKDFLKSYPKLEGVVERVAALPAIKRYYIRASQDKPQYECFLPAA